MISRILIIGWLLGCSGVTLTRAQAWQNDYALWREAIEVSPYKAHGHIQLGKIYEASGYDHLAINEYQDAIRLTLTRPDQRAISRRSEAVILLSGVLGRDRRYDEMRGVLDQYCLAAPPSAGTQQIIWNCPND